MNTAKLCSDGTHQMVILPTDFKMTGTEVYVKKIGNAIILISKDEGIKVHSELEKGLKDPNVLAFFKEQLMEISLA
jgi:virulence-associated protein VagC